MEEVMIEIKLDTPVETLDEAMEQSGYIRKGFFRYDYPELGHKWYERIRTGLYEKDGEFAYFAGITEWKGNKISKLNLGILENKKDKNPECIFN